VRLRDPRTQVLYRFPPGGEIESGESAAVAAVRETFEETGYAVKLLSMEAFSIDYPFTWGGCVYACTTSFFLAQVEGFPKPVAGHSGHEEGYEWVDTLTLMEEWKQHPEIQSVLLSSWFRNRKR
jgi:8-oxo-dGTP pyrophosphatase MutT (NUDIX family)